MPNTERHLHCYDIHYSVMNLSGFSYKIAISFTVWLIIGTIHLVINLIMLYIILWCECSFFLLLNQ